MRALLAVLLLAAGVAAVPADPALAAPSCHGVPATRYLKLPGTLTGTDGADVLVGSAGDDTINGLGGDDLVCGRDGDDEFNPGPGNDTVYAGGGDDDFPLNGLSDHEGSDTFYGEGGNDYLLDGDNRTANVAHGGPGDDYVNMWGTAYGDAGDDFVLATGTSSGQHDAYANGGDGNDEVSVGRGVARGGPGNDHVRVYGGVAYGGSGGDAIELGAAGDKAFGGSGRDFIDAVAPDDSEGQILDCGSWFDSFEADPSDTVRPNCEQGPILPPTARAPARRAPAAVATAGARNAFADAEVAPLRETIAPPTAQTR